MNPNKIGSELMCSGRVSTPALHVTPVLLLLNESNIHITTIDTRF